MLLLVGYLMMIRTAERRNAAGAVLCFLEGAYLAMLCFAVLPPAMVRRGSGVRQAVRRPAAGRDFWQRNIFHGDVLLRRALFLFLTAAVCFSWEIPVFPLAFLGGVGLYHASAGILPEPVSIRNALFSAGGFLAGVFLFSPLL